MRALAAESRIDGSAIGVSARHGIVTLNGTVGSWAEKHIAEEAAHRLVGVLDVANDIEIKPTWSAIHSDTEVAEAVRQALEQDLVPQRRIHTTVCDGGHVTLSGEVSTPRQRDDAERVVRNLEGVRLVTNLLALEPPPVDDRQRLEPM
jgi:osmotically-inducible protein OsmY